MGSKPSLMRNGLPRLSFSTSSDSTISSSAPRLKTASWWAISGCMGAWRVCYNPAVCLEAGANAGWDESILSKLRILAQSLKQIGGQVSPGRIVAVVVLMGVGHRRRVRARAGNDASRHADAAGAARSDAPRVAASGARRRLLARRAHPARRHAGQRACTPVGRRSAGAAIPAHRSTRADAVSAQARQVGACPDRRRRASPCAFLPDAKRRPAHRRRSADDFVARTRHPRRPRAPGVPRGRNPFVAVCGCRCGGPARRGDEPDRRCLFRRRRFPPRPATWRSLHRRLRNARGRRRIRGCRQVGRRRVRRQGHRHIARFFGAAPTAARATTRRTARACARRSCARRWNSRASRPAFRWRAFIRSCRRGARTRASISPRRAARRCAPRATAR